MVIISFYAVNQRAYYDEYNYYLSTPTLDAGFETLTYLVKKGWQLLRVRYSCMENGELTWVDLPVEAFDGQPMEGPLMSLQKEWEELFC